MTLLVSSLSALAASWSHLTDVNPVALTADEKLGFCIHDYILRFFKWIYLAAERWRLKTANDESLILAVY